MKARQLHLPRMSLAGILRIMGAMTVVAALIAHLLEGWSLWSDLSRYYVLLGSTALLAIAGLGTSRFLHENKSARVFVALSLLAVTACITTMGGLIHEWVQWQGGTSVSVTPTLWSKTGFNLLTLIGSAVFVGVPVVWLAYKVLARPQATNLAAVFLASAALIVIPIRTSFEIGLLIALAIALPAWFCSRFAKGALHFRTAEGRFALISLFVPALIMLVRSTWLYQADELLGWVLAMIGFIGLQFLRAATEAKTLWRFLATLMSLIVAAYLVVMSIILLEPLVADPFELPLFGLLGGLALWAMGWADVRQQAAYSVFAAVFMLVATLLNLGMFTEWHATFTALAMSVGIALLGWRSGQRSLILVAAVAALLALVPRLLALGALIDFTHWLTLGVLGVSALGAATLLERLRRPATGTSDSSA